MKKRITIMFVLMLVAVGTLYALSATSNAPNRVKNGFNRTFLPVQANVAYQIEFDTPVRELAGQTGDSLFLMTGEPGKVYLTDTKLKKPSTILLANPKIKRIVPRFYTTVVGNEVYILGGNAKAYAVGNLKTGKTKKVDLHLNTIFDNPVMLKDKFVARIIDTKTLDARFVTVGLDGKIKLHEKDISKGGGDAGMVYSSLLKYDAKNHQFVNLHYYDNGYEIFNEDLQLIRRGNTIDTIYHNPTQVFVKNGAVAYKHPPVAVNGYAAIYDNALYVRSKLLADNEDKTNFYSHTVLDKYNLTTGKYEGSFYLPNVDETAIAQFYFIASNKILAFSKNKVVVYQLNTKIMVNTNKHEET